MPRRFRMPRFAGHTALALAITGLWAASPLSAQTPVPNLTPKVPAELQNLTDSHVTVTIARLDPGQTVTQTFTPTPTPVPGIMSLNGEWPVAVVSGGEGQFNRKIRAVLKSPFGQVVADGCGYSRNAKATTASPTTKPALSAAGQFQAGSQDASSVWSVTVSYCDGAGAPPSGPSRALGEIKIFVSFRAAR